MKKTTGVLMHIVLFICAIFLTLAPIVHSKMDEKKINKIILNDEWTVKLNNTETYENVTLENFHMQVADKGTYIEMEREMPSRIEDLSTMLVYSIHSVVNVYLDDELIMNIGEKEHEEGNFIGYGHTFVNLPMDAAGKTVRITYLVDENNAFSTLTPPEIYKTSTALKDYVSERFSNLFVAIGLMAAGSCITLIAFFTYFKMREIERLFGIGVFSLCIGCWTLCNNDLALLFSSGLRVKSYMEYISLYLVMFPLLLYFQPDVERRDKRIEKILYDVALGIQLTLFFGILILHKLNILHFSGLVKTYQVFMVLVGLGMVYILVNELIHNKRHVILFWGFAGMLLVAVRDLVMFNVVKYLSNAGIIESNFKSYIGVAALIFVTSLLTDFLSEMRAFMYKTAENEVYVKMAYSDPLTGLYTRRKCHEVLEQYVEDGKEYGIVLFDLNGLKTANDSYGHLQGDELITRFANILKRVYNQGETIARLGGDEFTVVAPKKPGYRIKEREASLKEEIDKDNLKHDNVLVSVSLGYALSTEVEGGSYNEVMKLADKRMYADKERFYKETGFNRRRYD